MTIATSILKHVLRFIGVVLFAMLASLHEINAEELIVNCYARQTGFFYGTANGMDTVGVYSNYVVYYPNSGELELDGKSIYSFNDMVVECELGEIACNGKSMYLLVEVGDKTYSYPARFVPNGNLSFYIFEVKDIKAIEKELSKQLGFNLN